MDKETHYQEHPAYEAREEGDIEITTPEELEEAKKMAGVASHQEIMERAREDAIQIGDLVLQRKAEEELKKNQPQETAETKEEKEKIIENALESIRFVLDKAKEKPLSSPQYSKIIRYLLIESIIRLYGEGDPEIANKIYKQLPETAPYFSENPVKIFDMPPAYFNPPIISRKDIFQPVRFHFNDWLNEEARKLSERMSAEDDNIAPQPIGKGPHVMIVNPIKVEMKLRELDKEFGGEDGDILVKLGIEEASGQAHIQLLSKNPELGSGGSLSFGTYNSFVEARKAFTNYLESLKKRESVGE